ncbi:hypothetical protein [Hyalangium rubrum]|uniref:HEAT repeat domain-containing protein n=1 Tax=Hyalangium rubrum TaxID=3103134 RepID=A0ABU5HIZ7_9BACT|nr:hypothetical protein [Hyalangium sp. s54d21]MDY7233221.1 hypothetical protein [Hyalangium sp. s54d21]
MPTASESPGASSQMHGSTADLAGLIQDLSAQAFHRVVGAVWTDGRLSSATLPAVPLLVGALQAPEPLKVARAALLLGVLAETSAEKQEVREALRRAIPSALAAARRCVHSPPARLSLVFLLAHFPEDREQVLGGVDPGWFGPEDFSRLERCLRSPDFADPGLVDIICRGWPSPAFWKVTEEEAATDRRWRRTLDLSTEQVATYWREETVALLALLGAQAEFAIEEGRP